MRMTDMILSLMFFFSTEECRCYCRGDYICDTFWLSELFIRMNDGISLNGPEKRNAVISEFSAVIRSLATTYQDTFSKFFTPKDINRRKIDDFIAGLALLYFHGISTKVSDKNLWSAYESDQGRQTDSQV